MKQLVYNQFRLIIALIIVIRGSVCFAIDLSPDDPRKVELDSLFDVITSTYSTNACFHNIDVFAEKAREYNDMKDLGTAMQFKAGCYINMAMYDKLDSFVDSIETQSKLISENESAYYYVRYIYIMSQIYRGKYRFAIHMASELYELTDDYKSFTPVPGTDEVDEYNPVSWGNRLSALRCLGVAYAKLKLRKQAIQYFEEAISIASQYPTIYAQELIDNSCDLMTAGFYLEDKRQALEYVLNFEDQFREYEKFVEPESSDIAFYSFILQIAYSEIYSELGDMRLAEQHLLMAEELRKNYEIVGYFSGNYYKAKAIYCNKMGLYDLSLAYADSVLVLAKEENDFDNVVSVNKIKYNSLFGMERYRDACSIADDIISFTDSINDRRFMSSIEEFSAIVDIDKVRLEVEKDKASIRMWVIFTQVIIFSAILIILVVLIYQNNIRTRERQRLLSEQKALLEDEVARQTSELLLKNRDITNGISYAHKIQSSILPDIRKIGSGDIAGAFMINHPCEIVSGDFYWAMKLDDVFMVACADSTGHGVPGALMAMTGLTLLNEISLHAKERNPSDILELLDARLLDILVHNDESDVNDGIDMALAIYSKKSGLLRISSARRPVYLFHNDELITVKGVRRSIGDREEINHSRAFLTSEYQVNANDMLYLTTDGFVDQFGGQDQFGQMGERFSAARLTAMLDDIHRLPIDEQFSAVEMQMKLWQGSCPQVDDMAMVGIKF